MKRANFPKRRLRRREEAEARQVVYNMLTTEAKLNAIERRPGESSKEYRKLTGAAKNC